MVEAIANLTKKKKKKRKWTLRRAMNAMIKARGGKKYYTPGGVRG